MDLSSSTDARASPRTGGYDEWSTLLDDLFSGLLFWAGLVCVPAIVGGIAQSAAGRPSRLTSAS